MDGYNPITHPMNSRLSNASPRHKRRGGGIRQGTFFAGARGKRRTQMTLPSLSAHAGGDVPEWAEPLPPWGSPTLQSGGQNQKSPTSGPRGYMTPAASDIPNASERGMKSEVAYKWTGWLHNPAALGMPNASEEGTKSEVAHNWTGWLHNPCRLGGAQRVRAGNKIKSRQQVGRKAT